MENINIDNQPKQDDLISYVNINQINAQNLNMNINEISNQNTNEIPKINNLNFSPNMNIEQQNYNNSNNLINNNDNKIINLTDEEKLKCNQPISNRNTEFGKSNLTEEEKLKCKENGFILIGKTGVGKSSLLNILVGENVAKVGHSTKSETKSSTSFYFIEKKDDENIFYLSIIDTPGLYDTQGKEADDNQKKEIIQLISEEKIKIKGLLFLTNFQNERFDSSEQDSLIQYNAIFPLEEFWNRIILIFTHYYGDPDGDLKEDIRERADKILSEIINKIMEKVKNVSKPIKFENMNKKYINIYSKAKNEKQIKNNLLIRNDIVNNLIEFTKLTPMFSKIQIFNFEKCLIKKDDKYLYDCEFHVYLDANNKPVYQEFKKTKQYDITKENLKNQKIKMEIENCVVNENGNLVKKSSKKEGGLKEIFKNCKGKIGKGLTVVSLIGAICSSIFFLPTLPLCVATLAGGGFMMKDDIKSYMENNKSKMPENEVNQVDEGDEGIIEGVSNFFNDIYNDYWI